MTSITTPRRPSYAPSTSDVSSPPQSITRRPSSILSHSTVDSPATGDRKRRNRSLLRDYYGLANKGEQLDMDSPATFNPDAYFQSLVSSASLPDLLRKESELVNEIRELDGERQSLVYNHHHELIEASDTIRKMKSRAEALDTSLESLKTSFESISQLSTSLARPSPSTRARSSSSPRRPRRVALSSQPDLPDTKQERSGAMVSPSVSPTKPRPRRISSDASALASPGQLQTPKFDPLLHLSALVALPVVLRSLATSDERTRADALWGSWEPALRSWEDAGVEGAREVGAECRDVLRNAATASRRFSVSNGQGAGLAVD
ncbi:hypothetical protein JCM10212_003366 [Sporobolomyces blumeae]